LGEPVIEILPQDRSGSPPQEGSERSRTRVVTFKASERLLERIDRAIEVARERGIPVENRSAFIRWAIERLLRDLGC